MKKGAETGQIFKILFGLFLVVVVLIIIFGSGGITKLAKSTMNFLKGVNPEDQGVTAPGVGEEPEERDPVTMTSDECRDISSCSDYPRDANTCNDNPCGVSGGCFFDNDIRFDDCLSCSSVARCGDYGRENREACNDNPCEANLPEGCIWDSGGIWLASCDSCTGSRAC